MSESVDEIRAGSRREFLLGAGVAASGAALLGADLPAQAQTPQGATTCGRTIGPGLSCRCTGRKNLSQLGPLKNLGGTWVGKGFNLISLPDFDNPQGPQTFRVKLNATREILEFQRIGGNVPNRGSQGQKDINIFGLTYLQRISDSPTSGALHIEPGLWLHVPATTVPDLPATVVRQGSIPHGTSILVQGAIIPAANGPPTIHAVDSTPFNDKGPITSADLSGTLCCGHVASRFSTTVPQEPKPGS